MTLSITCFEGGGAVRYLVCTPCFAWSQGIRDASDVDESVFFAMVGGGWQKRLENGVFFYVCPTCIESERKPQAMETFKKQIKLKLTAEQKTERKDRLVTVEQELDRVKSEKRDACVTFNDETKELAKERKELLIAITTGIEEKDVDCYQRVDEKRLEVQYVRVDTQELIPELTRPMTVEERQMKLDDAPPKKGKAKPAKPPKGKSKAKDDGGIVDNDYQPEATA